MKRVRIDETDNWDPAYLAKHHIRRVFGVYQYDPKSSVYCCELTPSYELELLGSQAEYEPDFLDWDGLEQVEEELRQADAGEEPYFRYVHCREVDAMPEYTD
jgi:hypothetical protein